MSTNLNLESSVAPALPMRKFSVDQYHQLGELGVLSPEDNVELLEGWIVYKMNQRPIHGFIVAWLTETLQNRVGKGFCVRCQLPITTQRSEPEPDIAIIAGSHADYKSKHPTGSDCRLIIEIADTSIEKDRSKAKIYLDDGVNEYWIVNVNAKCIERYSISSGADKADILSNGDTIAISCGDTDISFDVTQFFE